MLKRSTILLSTDLRNLLDGDLSIEGSPGIVVATSLPGEILTWIAMGCPATLLEEEAMKGIGQLHKDGLRGGFPITDQIRESAPRISRMHTNIQLEAAKGWPIAERVIVTIDFKHVAMNLLSITVCYDIQSGMLCHTGGTCRGGR